MGNQNIFGDSRGAEIFWIFGTGPGEIAALAVHTEPLKKKRTIQPLRTPHGRRKSEHQIEQSEIAISVLALAWVPTAYHGGNITLVRTALAPTCCVHGKTSKLVSRLLHN